MNRTQVLRLLFPKVRYLVPLILFEIKLSFLSLLKSYKMKSMGCLQKLIIDLIIDNLIFKTYFLFNELR